MVFDLRGKNLAEVTDFIFGHPVSVGEGDTGWWWKAEVVLEPAEYIAHITAVFRNPQSLRSQYSREQLEQGFWFLISGATGGFHDVLWNPDVSWELRAELILASVDLYQKFFALDALETSAYMFWDALAYDYCVPTRHPETDVEDRRVQESMFAALQQILDIDSLPCQLAVHGLGHLRHPDTETTITRYLERHPELGDDDRTFARACITGEIQ